MHISTSGALLIYTIPPASVKLPELGAYPAQAHGDPPRLRLFTEQMWKQFQRKLQSLGLSPKPKRSEGEGDKPIRPARTPSALSWELAWRRRG
jgi:hypothetical protein